MEATRKTMATIIQSRHDTAARWASINPTLAEGELGIETDTGKIKVGDGVTVWNSLAYFTGDAPVKSVNSKTGAVLLDASDVGALPSNTQYQEPINDLATIRAGAAAGATAVQPAALNDYVPTSTTVNGKALSSNVILDADDVGAPSDVQVNGTSVVTDGVANIPVASQDTLGVSKVSPTYGLTVSNGIIVGSTKTASVYSTAANSLALCKGTLDNIKDDLVRSVRPAYTEISASSATYTLESNATFGQTPSQAVTYTLPVFDSSVDCWIKLFIDTTNSSSIAFATTDSTQISPDGTTSIQSGHKYIVIVQSNSLKSCWEIYIIDGGAV